MQQAAGIIAEYNPFHNGHLYHLQTTKKLTSLPIVVVMSGSIMQRGEPAFLDKWTRAKLAVDNGADLVIELPAVFSLRSAQYFAAGATALLEACGCISHLSCGAETPDFDFPALSKLINSNTFQSALKENIKQGLSYAAAYEKTLQELTDTATRLHSPNDILALEYCKALISTDIQALFIKRREASYNDTHILGDIASASAVRTAFFSGQLQKIRQAVPENVWQQISTAAGYDQQLLWQLISYRLRMLTPEQIAAACQCSEGLENSLKRAAACSSLSQTLTACSAKRYPFSRLRRLFMQLLLHKKAQDFEQQQPEYIRVLAFNDTGRALLKTIKAHNNLPIITKLGKNPAAGHSSSFAEQLAVDTAASDLLALLQHKPESINSDYLTSPYYKK